MNNNIYIYGDSFADPKWEITHNNEFVWTEQLAQHYPVYNYALKGTGPEYSIQRLLDVQPKDNSMCIFIVSDANRLNLKKFWNHSYEQVHILDVAAKRIPHVQHSFVRQLYDHYLTDDSYDGRTAAMIGAVNSLTSAYTRTLIWPISTLTTNLRTDSSVTLIKKGLVDISEQEWRTNQYHNPYIDSRPNHFSEINHRVMFDLIVNWIEYNTPPDPDQFHCDCA